MATVYGVNHTLAYVNNPSSKIPKGEQFGRVHVAYDSYAPSGALALNDVIKMMKLPAGARVINVVLDSTDLGTTGALSVGWEANGVDSANTSGFISSADVSTSANTVAMLEQNNAAGFCKQFSVETQISILVATATTAAGTIKLLVEYVID